MTKVVDLKPYSIEDEDMAFINQLSFSSTAIAQIPAEDLEEYPLAYEMISVAYCNLSNKLMEIEARHKSKLIERDLMLNGRLK